MLDPCLAFSPCTLITYIMRNFDSHLAIQYRSLNPSLSLYYSPLTASLTLHLLGLSVHA